jgi:glycerol-3-phosphate dehydrogenase (NAD(P)+)
MKVGYLGAGCWGFCLATVLASKGHEIVSWTTKQDLADHLNKFHEHPYFPGFKAPSNIRFTTSLEDALENIDLLVESVTSAGIRPVFEKVKALRIPHCPIVLTSKGIEQNSGKILTEVVIEILGSSILPKVGFLSGPGYAQEVIKGLPTSVVGTAYEFNVMMMVCDTFTTDTFRVYPNMDIQGVAFGGALKNIIAIACGISDGLELGNSSKAALMTRGLHEIRKLAVARGCRAETLNGLSGMGDICLTCSSIMSRNFRFGYLIAQGTPLPDAYRQIQTVVEGAYTVVSALQLSKELQVPMPISDTVYKILYESMKPIEAVQMLMKRTIKEEHL